MKVNTKALKLALADVGRVIKTRTTVPAFYCVKLSDAGGMLKLECTNADAWVSRKIECDVPMADVLVNHRMLSDLVALVDSEFIHISSLKMNKLSIEWGGKLQSVRTLPLEQYLDAPTFKGEALGCSLPDLAEAIDAVSWAASTDAKESGYRVCVLIDLEPTKMTCAAVSQRGMAIFSRPLICESRQIVIHASQADMITPELAAPDALAYVTDNLFIVENAVGGCAIKLTESKGVNYKQITEQRGDGKGTTLAKDVLLRNCKVAMAINEQDKGLTLSPLKAFREQGSDSVTITTFGGENQGVETIHAPGEPLDMYISSEYLRAAIAKAPLPTVNIVSQPNAVFIESGDMTYFVPKMIEPVRV